MSKVYYTRKSQEVLPVGRVTAEELKVVTALCTGGYGKPGDFCLTDSMGNQQIVDRFTFYANYEPNDPPSVPAPALLTLETGFASPRTSLDILLDDLEIPDEDSGGFRLELKERLRELKCRWAGMKARDEAYGRKEPVEELLRVQTALLSKEHPDAHAAHFVREVCRLFGFAEPPPMPDSLWYRTALAVIRERVTKSS